MKAFIFTALLLLAGCAKTTSLEPEVDGYPELRFKEVKKNEYGVPMYNFQLIKDGDEGDLSYFGYTTESPTFLLKIKEDDGWKEINYGWCGTGLERQNVKNLPAVSTVAIGNHSENNKPWKLGIMFYKNVNGEPADNGVIIWSNEVPAK